VLAFGVELDVDGHLLKKVYHNLPFKPKMKMMLVLGLHDGMSMFGGSW
jgi:hypothetical protein